MIVILFTPGNFGSTLEYCLRTFSYELKKTQLGLLENGSMHGYKKECHILHAVELQQLDDSKTEIVTAVFPNLDYVSHQQILELYQKLINNTHRVILVDSVSIDQAYRTQLFAAHKIDDFLEHVLKDKPQEWNLKYRHWNDMQKVEIREALSFHVDQQHQCINLAQHLPEAWHIITPDDILDNLVEVVPQLIKHCDLTANTADLLKFYQDWRHKQQYIISEFSLIRQISSAVKTGVDLQWSPLSLYGEAILQSMLRRQGHNLDMSNLDTFPTKLSSLEDVFLKEQ